MLTGIFNVAITDIYTFSLYFYILQILTMTVSWLKKKNWFTVLFGHISGFPSCQTTCLKCHQTPLLNP